MALDAQNTRKGTDPEAALLDRFVAGDVAAARALTRALSPRLFAQAHRMLGNRAEAEDVVQDALMRLWRMAPRWDHTGGARLATWAYRVVANLCIDRMRRSRGAAPIDPDEHADPAPGTEMRLQQAARRRALYAALRHLPARQQQAVVLRHIEGLGNPEIAAIMDITVEAVESLTARGKRALAAALAGKREELGFEDDET